jgi:predicted ATPase
VKIDNLELPQLTVLIGANGAGKSNLIRFFEMLSWMLKGQKLQEFVLFHGGGDDQFFMGARKTPTIRAELQLETEAGINEYRFALGHLPAGDKVVFVEEAYRFLDSAKDKQADWQELPGMTLESGLIGKQSKTAKTIVHLLCECSIYQFHDTSEHASIRNKWDIADSARLRSDGGNLAAVLLDLQQNEYPRYQQIVRQIQRVLPSFDDFVLQPVAGKIALLWRGKASDKLFGAHLTSDGSLRLFCLLTLLNLAPSRLPDVLFFDEPELGLHPHAIILISQMMKRVAQTRQVFIATQSPYMVDCFALENIIVADSINGATTLRKLPEEQYRSWLDDEYLLSDIWLKDSVGVGSARFCAHA